jgi:hypothetical protein
LDESKTDKLTLKPILGCSHSLDESQRYSPYPRFISQPNESKRAEKMLELAIHKSRARAEKMLEFTLFQVFSDLDESQKAKKPTLDLS